MGVVGDMYRRRVPFLANIYTIDDNFGSVDVADSELQQFEKMAFSRNPDQSVHDPCYVDQLCQNPVEPIMKAANPRLKESFPEAHEYFTGFRMTTSQINNVVSFYLDRMAARTDESHTEIWLQAACDWMKSDDEATVETWNNSQWLVDVVRYDCLEDCGMGQCDYMTGECVGLFANTTETMYADMVDEILTESGMLGMFGQGLIIIALIAVLSCIVCLWITREICACFCCRRRGRSGNDSLPNPEQRKLIPMKMQVVGQHVQQV